MGTVEIVVIVLVVAFVVVMAAATIVRKLKGKPSLGSDCGCCPYCGNCNGGCGGKEDVSDVVAEAKARQTQKSESCDLEKLGGEGNCSCNCSCETSEAKADDDMADK